MIRKILFFSALLFFVTTSYSQDNKSCEAIDGFKTDYCYGNEAFKDYCAQFNAETNFFYLVRSPKPGKTNTIKLNLPGEDQEMNAWLLDLASVKKNKMTVKDALFLQAALPEWKKEELTIGMLTTPSGLMYKTYVQGDGKLPEKGKKVYVHYRGFLENGNEFDNSFKRGQPFSFVLGKGQVIKGWDEGIALLPVGSRALLRIPPELGYGSRGAGAAIPPNSVLFFEVEVINAD